MRVTFPSKPSGLPREPGRRALNDAFERGSASSAPAGPPVIRPQPGRAVKARESRRLISRRSSGTGRSWRCSTMPSARDGRPNYGRERQP
jgi:hypothetical protein